MSRRLVRERDELRRDAERVRGRPVSTFLCPILFRDEQVPLCQGHIIPESFANSRRWTVQRQDVDNFFGTYFEADFEVLQHRPKTSPADVLISRELRRKLKPRITHGSRPIDYYVAHPSEAVPSQFVTGEVQDGNRSVKLVLKLSAEELPPDDGTWAVAVERDLRLPALVCLIRSAHLTMFKLMRYQYALSAAGMFVGGEILGTFFRDNGGTSKTRIHQAAYRHFAEFVPMVRPVVVPPGRRASPPRGTVDDRRLLACGPDIGHPWGIVVFVRTGDDVNAVLLPVFDHPDRSVRFYEFLTGQGEFVEVRDCVLEEGCWRMSKMSRLIKWPKNETTRLCA